MQVDMSVSCDNLIHSFMNVTYAVVCLSFQVKQNFKQSFKLKLNVNPKVWF